ncbi:solute carrier family 17 member 9 isoform X3 [Peromyscus californicus insignis]|uniref:solute carrier family 17 member 9 isoform X3 n=1 Tax=Peromyscus californicus insignis TaxID=564181 RepID=UPI0022A6D1F5|nr:solute carrier family 17 member 9 isoform X3 [Peromyscus californicus insignis]
MVSPALAHRRGGPMGEELNKYLGGGLTFRKRRLGVAALRQWVQKHETDRLNSVPYTALSPSSIGQAAVVPTTRLCTVVSGDAPSVLSQSISSCPHVSSSIGGEKVILLSASTWGFITVVTPLLAHLGSGHLAFMTFSRILTGLLQGVYFPALTSLLSQRVQESERAFTYSTVGAGSQFGTLVTGGVGSVLLDWCGWQSVFYFSGGLTLLWVYYVYRYLLNEKDLVLALGVLAQGLPMARPSKVPWRQLFRKPSVWAAICSQLSSACSFFILLSWLPTFFKETFPHSKGWVFNVVPWLLAIPASLFSGFLSDRLISQGYRVITVRKFMQVMGLGLSSIFALCLGHTTSFLKAVIFASASVSFQTFNHSGISVNIQDLAPSCAGFLFGVANTAGALAGP